MMEEKGKGSDLQREAGEAAGPEDVPIRIVGFALDPVELETLMGSFAEDLETTSNLERLARLLEDDEIDLVIIDGVGAPAPLASVLSMLADHPSSAVVLADEPPDPSALLLAGAGWLLRRPLGPTEREALFEAARRTRRSRRDAQDISALQHGLRSHRTWADTTRRALSEMLHELKTPIAVVRGYTANLLDEIDGPIAEAQRASLERIRAAAKLLTDVTRESAPRLEPPELSKQTRSMRTRGRRTQLSPELLCREVVGLFHREASERGVRLEVGANGSIPPIWGERPRLTQVLVNLISNAMRFVDSGGRIAVALSAHRGVVEAAVSDDGPGIPEENLDRIFESGFSGQNRSGLGLAICRQIAEEHSGELIVEANGPLGGATFRLRLPIDPRHSAHDLELLLVDDMVLAGQLLVELKNRHGTHVPASKPKDMEALARRILETSSTVVFAGRVEERLSHQTIDLPRPPEKKR